MRAAFLLKACLLPEPEQFPLADDLALICDCAKEAGELAESFLPQVHKGEKVWKKNDKTPVTEADLAVNHLLQQRLSTARPDYGWLSEETADELSARDRKRVWVVDPIDGTRAFARPNDPYWCIAIALVENQKPVAGVLFAPELDELFMASAGGGAFLNGKRLAVSRTAREEGAKLISTREVINHRGWPTPWPSVELCDPKPNATLYRMALVATGKWDATFALGRKSDWDLAAGAILVSEAGGIASTHLGEDFTFNRKNPAQRSMLAAGPELHSLLLERIRHVDLTDPNA